MKQVSKLSLLVLAILMVGCNEKVSPELQEGKSTTPTSPGTPVAPDEYYFGVENSSDPLLNYNLHKTGAGNSKVKCEVRSTTKLSNDIFRGNPAANDITCYFEAEELSLYNSGFKFKIKASKNTCDFVGYSPYGYYNQIPGDSTATYYQMTCANDETNNANIAAAAAERGIDITSATGNAGCNDWIIDPGIIAAGTREKFTPTSDDELCRFNYDAKSGGNRCDVGTITVNELVVNYTPATDTELPILKHEIVTREIECGGEIYNCVEGPTKKISEEATKTTEISQTALNKDFEIEYEYPGLEGTTGSVIQYANYRRNLSNTNLEYGNSAGLPGSYKSVWSDSIYGKIFEPRVMDYFASNLLLNGNTFIDGNDIFNVGVANNKWAAYPLAADPFMGLVDPVNPFYTFYCFDTAWDIKARIRMVVRDWDRVFPNSTDNELLSDLFKNSSARQDIPGIWEIPFENDNYVKFNDRTDWDDLIPMIRTPGSFDPSSTYWEPADGWFNPLIFPRFIKK